MLFPPQFLEDLRARVSTSSVVGRRVKLVRKGREFSGLCPFHNEKTPSFFVNDDKGFYHCFGCGAHGDIVSFVMQTEGLGFAETVQRLASEAGISVPSPPREARREIETRETLKAVLEAACLYFEQALREPSGAAAREYLYARGVTEADIGRFRLGWAPDRRDGLQRALKRQGMGEGLLREAGLCLTVESRADLQDRFRGRVIFPICNRRGEAIAFGGRLLGKGQPKYLNSPETPLFHKGSTLYALHHARPKAAKTGEILLVEGYMDVIALHRAGFESTVSPLGTALSDEQMETLWQLAAEPILCLDGDSAGQRAMMRAALRALPRLKAGRSLRFTRLPDGLDPDELLRQPGGPARFQEILHAARPLIEVLWTGAQAGRVLDTPERKAEFSRDLQAQVASIIDEEVRRFYQIEVDRRLKDRFGVAPAPMAVQAPRSAYIRSPRPSDGRHWGKPPADLFLKKRPETENAAAAARIVERRQACALLAAFLNHPFLFDSWFEALAEVSFFDAELDNFRQETVSLIACHPGFDADVLQSHLAESEHAFILSHVMDEEIAKIFPFTRREALPHEVRAQVGLMFDGLLRRKIAEDRRALLAVAQSEESPDAWARYKALVSERANNDGRDSE